MVRETLVDAIIALLRPIPFPKHRLLSQLIPSQGTRRARIFGSTMDLDVSELIQRAIYLGTYEREETRFAKSILRTGQTVVDVGANVGYYTALAASRVGKTGRVLAFEPSPLCYKKLAAMKRRNRLTRCFTWNAGLSDIDGELMLYEPTEDCGNLNATMVPNPDTTPILVEVRRLDDVLREEGIERVDLLKVDVEGHELRVFKGAAESLRKGIIRSILCEVNEYHLHDNGTSGRELMLFLRECGFDTPNIPPPPMRPPPGHRNYLIRRATG